MQKYLYGIFLLGFVLTPNFSFASFTTYEGFESYANTDTLNGKTGGTGWVGAWVSNAGVNTITNTEVDEGLLSAWLIGGDVQRLFSTTTTGTFFYSYYASGDQVVARLANAGTYVIYNRVQGGNFEYYDGAGYVSLGAITTGVWHRIGIEIDNAGHAGQARYQIDGGTWSSWDDTANGGNTVDTFRIFADYIDDISPEYSVSGGGSTEEDPTVIDWGSATTTNRMLGSLNFGITILIVFFILGFSGYLWNKTGKKKPWQ